MWLLLDLSRELVKNDNKIWSERFPCKDFPGINPDFHSLANKNLVLETKDRLKSINVYIGYKEVELKVKCYQIINYQYWILLSCF